MIIKVNEKNVIEKIMSKSVMSEYTLCPKFLHLKRNTIIRHVLTIFLRN